MTSSTLAGHSSALHFRWETETSGTTNPCKPTFGGGPVWSSGYDASLMRRTWIQSLVANTTQTGEPVPPNLLKRGSLYTFTHDMIFQPQRALCTKCMDMQTHSSYEPETQPQHKRYTTKTLISEPTPKQNPPPNQQRRMCTPPKHNRHTART